jgi:nucleolar protein 9
MYQTSDDLWKDTDKPAKPESDTVTYLRQIEGLLDDFVRKESGHSIPAGTNDKTIDQDDDEEEEEEDAGDDKLILVNNVFEEIAKQEAALSTDKMSSSIIEKVLKHGSDKQLVQFGVGLQGYFLFLASNRYSSHVIQTFLSLAGGVIERAEGGEAEGLERAEVEVDGETLDMAKIICSFCDEIDKQNGGKWLSLARDICGTHVLRSLLMVLGGKPVVKNSGGFSKKKKKGQKKGRDQFGSFNLFLNHVKDGERVSYQVPGSFAGMFEMAFRSIRALPQANVYDLCFDSNASSVMQLLLLMAPNLESRDDLAKYILDWDQFQRLKEEDGAAEQHGEAINRWLDEIVQGQSASHALEAILRGVSPEFFDELFKECFKGRVARYAQLPSANFVVQQLLCCLRTKEQAKACAKELIPIVPEILGARTCLGVIWRLLEACLAHQTKGKDVCRALTLAASSSRRDVVESLLAITAGSAAKVGASGSREDPHPHAEGGPSAATSKRKGIRIDIAGARVLQNLLHLHFSICRPVLESIVALPPRTLAALGKDPVGSRSVIEPVLDGPDEFNSFKQKLIDRLAGCYVGLAADRFGTYATQKCFAVATAKRKESIAKELTNAIHVLEGSSFGRHVVTTCSLNLFQNQKHKWLEQMKGSQNKKRVFEEVFGKMDKTNTDKGGGDDEVQAGASKRKRKRKKKKKKKEEEVVE